MTETFLPEDIKVRGDNGEGYADAYGLTCAQLGSTIGKLLEVRPNARFTSEDLAGYHFIQYGMDPEVTLETIQGVQSGMWSDWDKADNLRANLPVVLGDTTENVKAGRIRLGRPRTLERQKTEGDFSKYFDNVTESDHHRSSVQSLYPKEGVSLEYHGRSTFGLGSVVMGGCIYELDVHTDVLELVMDDGSSPRIITANSTNRSTREIQSIRLM